MFSDRSQKPKIRLDAPIKKYPTKKAALLPALWVAQEENDGWVPREAMKEVAEYLGLAPADVEGVATFYTMYQQGARRQVPSGSLPQHRLHGASAPTS